MKNLILSMLFCLATTSGAFAQEAEIKSTIDRQIDAFRADDFATAFGFASPSLQRFFQTPETFGRMVVEGYPMVWRPAQVRYLGLREHGGVWWQKVMITDQEGGTHFLAYRMVQMTDGWRIAGVQILDAPGAAV